jgi:aminoglycoside phosphotransferase (APT) family kinase protein
VEGIAASCHHASMVTLHQLERIAEGREAEIFAWDAGRVLRLFRGARSRAVLEHEADAMRAARSVLPYVPDVFDIVEVDGRPGIIMERIDGPDFITLLGSKPWLVWRAGTILGRVQAELHGVAAPDGLPQLRERIRLICHRPMMPRDIAEKILPVLETMPDGVALCHGDFHPGNLLMTARGPVVIDWPNVTRGDPTADFARSDLLLHMGSPPPGTPALVNYMQGLGRKLIRTSFRRAYLRARPVSNAQVARWQLVRAGDRLAGDNIPEEREQLLRLLRGSHIA